MCAYIRETSLLFLFSLFNIKKVLSTEYEWCLFYHEYTTLEKNKKDWFQVSGFLKLFRWSGTMLFTKFIKKLDVQ